MSKNPKVKIHSHILGEGGYTIGNKDWDMSTIIKASESLKVFDLQLAAIDLNVFMWGKESQDMVSFLCHFKRIKKTKLNHPVILDPSGYIIDGWHRVAKAILSGKRTIKAIRLIVMPEPDRINTIE